MVAYPFWVRKVIGSNPIIPIMLEKFIYEIVGILTIVSAIMVISVKNPVHSILYLILVFDMNAYIY